MISTSDPNIIASGQNLLVFYSTSTQSVPQEDEKKRIAKESSTGAEPTERITETERAERIKNIVVTQKEVHIAYRKLASDGQIKSGTAEEYVKKFSKIITWLGGDALSNVVPLLKNPEAVKKKILEGKEKQKLNLSSIKDYINVLSTLCRNCRIYLKDFCIAVPVDEYSKMMSGDRALYGVDQIEKTKNERAVPYSEIEKALKNIRKSKPNSQEHLIIALYNINAWRDNVGNLRVVLGEPPNDKQNIIV